ncbi:ubiquitin-like protein 7 [Neocloeon triangulifer]|uniref:ubiquitin-like protein 7 n=1 Tax=Neocloeon triangulifer TaxID=2078957 RepID=UPI00286F2922|nr:ubiquitin-like protein 7 [Neocloeon triangulifer]
MDSPRVLLSIRIPVHSSPTLREVSFTGSVQELRSLAAKETSSEPDLINLIYRGLVLRDGNDLSTYGLQTGETVHVFSKSRPTVNKERPQLTNEEASQIALALKSAAAGIRFALSRLNKADIFENVLAAIPGLKEDPVAVSILRDPDLLMLMVDAEVVKRVSKKCPLLAEAVKHLAAEFADHGKNDAANNDDMETEDSPRQGSRQITGNQLAAALASAISGVNRSRQAPTRLFTPEMLNSALMQAFQSVPSLANSPAVASNQSAPTNTAPTPPTAGPSTAPPAGRWAQELQQMRELGLTDDNLSVQMLEITNGDVQAAVDLIIQSQFN